MKKVIRVIKTHKFITAICIIAIAVAGVIYFAPKDPTLGYTEEIAATRDIVTYNSFVGNVGFMTEMNVLSKASAEILEVKVEAGDSVSKGDIIAVLDGEAIEKNIEKAEISLKNQKTANEHSLADAQRAYDNFKYALDNGLNSTLNSSRIQLESAQKNYDTLLTSFNDYADNLEEMLKNGYGNDARAMIDARNDYHNAVSEFEYLESVIAQKTEAFETLTEQEKYFLERYKENLYELENKVKATREEYETRVKNYADNNDSNFKTIVDNL